MSVPDEAATYETHTDLTAAGLFIATSDLEVAIVRSSCDILSDAIATIGEMDGQGCRPERVLAHLNEVQDDCAAGGIVEPEAAIDDLLMATQKLRNAPQCDGAAEARLDLDALLRVLSAEVSR